MSHEDYYTRDCLNFQCHPWLDQGSRIYPYKYRGKSYYVYILASRKNGTLYIGSTSNLAHRIWQHKNKAVEGFTEKYDVEMLVYFETATDANSAVTRERQLKKWKREWKIKLIGDDNPKWNDLCESVL